MTNTFPHELQEALDELDREYHLGTIDRGEWSDRRDSHVAWFAERGVGEDEEPADAAAGAADADARA